VSIGELVERVGAILGRTLVIETDPARVRPASSEVGRLLADASLARSLFGWEPTVSLDDGLKATLAWVEANLGLFRVDQYTT
jgi:nucleoside-diphosphate-sugar epimerase